MSGRKKKLCGKEEEEEIVYGKLKIAIKIYYQHSFDVRKLMARKVFPLNALLAVKEKLMVMWKIRLCDFYFGLRLWLDEKQK